MDYVLKFLRVQVKRVTRILPRLLVISFTASLCVAGAFYYWVNHSTFITEKKNFVVGIVGDVDESYLGFGIKAVQTLDDSRYMVDFEAMTEEEARRRFMAGEITGYVIIPDGLVDSFSYGRNDKVIKYIVSDGQKGITAILIKELADIVSVLVTQSQAAVFGMQNILIDRNRWDILEADTNELNFRMIDYVLGRTSLVEEEPLGISNGISFIPYYMCGLFVVMLVLLGIDYSVCVTTRSNSLNRVFKAKGVEVPVQVTGEYLSYLVMMILAVSGLVVMIFAAVSRKMIVIEEWGRDPGEFMVSFLFHTIPVIALIAAMQFLFYEFTNNVVSSVLLQFVAGMVMCYLAGCFYPKDLMPSAVTAIGNVLPPGVALTYLGNAVRGENSAGNAIVLYLYIIVFVAAACVVRNWRISHISE